MIKRFFLKETVYAVTIIISIILIIPFYFNNCVFFSILSSIGCSGLAAAIMAIFLDFKTENEKKKKRIQKAKATYFQKLNDELICLMQRILWFDERINDNNFDWSFPPEEYSSLPYFLFSSRYPTEEITFEEAISRLKICSSKYTLDKMRLLPDNEKVKITKMFSIISASGKYLKECIDNIKQNEIILDIENYLSLEEIKSLYFDVGLSLVIMAKKDKNYSVAITLITNTAIKLREECNYKNNIKIALMGSVSSESL